MSRTTPPALELRLPEPVVTPSSDGTSICTYDLGGAGSDVVFVHATGFCAGVWGPVAGHLDDHRRAALDVRGHGRSAIPAAGMDWRGTAQDVLATIDALGLDRPFGVGHSMGGASLVLAEQARPGTFRGLWIFEPIIFPTELARMQDGENPLAAGARRRRADFPSAAEAYANFANKPPLSSLTDQALGAYVEYGFEPHADGSVSLRCRPEVEAETYQMGSEHGAWDRLGDVACPVTVARGGDTGPGPAALVPGIVDRLPHGRIEEHQDLGHFGPLEAPEVIAATIRGALEAVDTTR